MQAPAPSQQPQGKGNLPPQFRKRGKKTPHEEVDEQKLKTGAKHAAIEERSKKY